MVFWDKISNNMILQTIWTHVYRHQNKLDLRELNTVFEDKIVEKPKAEVQTKQKKIDLIGDDTRSKVVQIALMKLFKINKLNWSQIKQMIIEINEQMTDLHSFFSLEKLAPTQIEREIGKNFKGDLDTLDDPSRWICEINDVPRYEQRFRSLELISEFNKEYESNKVFLHNFFSLMETFQDNQQF